MDLSIDHDLSRKLIPHIIYKFPISLDEFSKKKYNLGLRRPKPAQAGFQNQHGMLYDCTKNSRIQKVGQG